MREDVLATCMSAPHMCAVLTECRRGIRSHAPASCPGSVSLPESTTDPFHLKTRVSTL